MQAALAATEESSDNKTSEDYADTANWYTSDTGDMFQPSPSVTEELLNLDDNDIKIARANNIDLRLGLITQINEIESLLVACTLPDGSVEQLSPEACLAAGGTYDTGMNDLLYGLNLELDKLGGSPSGKELKESYTDDELKEMEDKFSRLGKNIITSLLNRDEDVTVKNVTAIKGKRYGFYQSDIK
jgi:hypothetical protein